MSDIIPPIAQATGLPNNTGRVSLLLLASLMFNLLLVGLLIGQFWGRGPGGHQGGPAYAQFVPGRFFSEVGRDRRRELTDSLRASRQDMQKLNGQSKDNAQKLAAELDQDNYDVARVGALIDGFMTGPESLAAGGGKVLKDFYAKLTPAERKALAKTIRDAPSRGERGWRGRFWN